MGSVILQVIAGWVLAFVVIAGLGQWIRLMFGLRSGWRTAFWMGYAVLIAVLQGWWLVAAVDWRASFGIGAVGIVGALVGGIASSRAFRPTLQIRIVLRQILFWGVLGIIAVYVASRALDSMLDFDSVFYHISAIRWRNEFPALTGLGNLHYRLAFNQSFFLFCGWLNVYPAFYPGLGMGYTFANSLLLIVLIAECVGMIWNSGQGTVRWIGLMVLPLAIYRALSQPYSANISSPSPDLGVFIFQTVAAMYAAGIVFKRSIAVPPPEVNHAVLLIVALSAVSVTQKLSAVFFGVALSILIVGWWLWRNRGHLREIGRTLILIGVLGGAIMAGWLVIGYRTSGYPAFPNTVGALAVDYKVPDAVTIEARDWIYSWARYPVSSSSPGDVLGNWDWLPTWIRMMNIDPINLFLFVVPLYLAGGALLVYALKSLITRRIDLRGGVIVLPAMLSCLAWWIAAPDPRFAGASFWIMAIGLTAMIVDGERRVWLRRLIPLPFIVIAAGLLVYGYQTDFSDRAKFPIPVTIPITRYRTASGFTYNVAADADSNLQMGDPALPASPYLIPKLELRGKSILDGFRTAR